MDSDEHKFLGLGAGLDWVGFGSLSGERHLPLRECSSGQFSSVLQPHRSLFYWQRIGRKQTQMSRTEPLTTMSAGLINRGCGASRVRLISVHLWFKGSRGRNGTC